MRLCSCRSRPLLEAFDRSSLTGHRGPCLTRHGLCQLSTAFWRRLLMDQDKDVVPAQPASGTSRKDFLKKTGTIAAGAAALAVAGAPALVEAAAGEKPPVLRE